MRTCNTKNKMHRIILKMFTIDPYNSGFLRRRKFGHFSGLATFIRPHFCLVNYFCCHYYKDLQDKMLNIIFGYKDSSFMFFFCHNEN